MKPHTRSHRTVWFGSPLGAALLVALLVLALYLLTQHTAHVLALLPVPLILVCPLLHVFMHDGHHDGYDGSRPWVTGEGVEAMDRSGACGL